MWVTSWNTTTNLWFVCPRFSAQIRPATQGSLRRSPAADLQCWEDRYSLVHLHSLQRCGHHLQRVQPAGLWYVSSDQSLSCYQFSFSSEGNSAWSDITVLLLFPHQHHSYCYYLPFTIRQLLDSYLTNHVNVMSCLCDSGKRQEKICTWKELAFLTRGWHCDTK